MRIIKKFLIKKQKINFKAKIDIKFQKTDTS